MRPSRLLVQSYTVRHLHLWLMVRAFHGVVVLGAAMSAQARLNPLAMPLSAVGALILVSAGVSLLQMARHHEFDLLGNLGVARASIAALVLVPPVVGEALLLAVRP